MVPPAICKNIGRFWCIFPSIIDIILPDLHSRKLLDNHDPLNPHYPLDSLDHLNHRNHFDPLPTLSPLRHHYPLNVKNTPLKFSTIMKTPPTRIERPPPCARTSTHKTTPNIMNAHLLGQRESRHPTFSKWIPTPKPRLQSPIIIKKGPKNSKPCCHLQTFIH